MGKKDAKQYTCACGKTMERNMRVIQAHAITECPNVKRALR